MRSRGPQQGPGLQQAEVHNAATDDASTRACAASAPLRICPPAPPLGGTRRLKVPISIFATKSAFRDDASLRDRVLAADPEFVTHVHRFLPVLSGFLTCIFAAFVVLGFIDDSGGAARPWIVGTDIASCLFYLVFFVAARAGRVPEHWTHPLCVVFGLLPAANSLLAFGLTEQPFFLTYLTMLAVGCGAFMLSLPWMWFLFGLMSASAAVVTSVVLSPLDAAQASPALVGAFLVASFIVVVRRFHIIDSQRALAAMRREAEERKRAEEHLAHIQRLESVGKLASGIAHDFNNLLMVILGYTECLIEDCEDEEVVSDLKIVHGAGQSAATLAAKLLAFGRQQVLQDRVIDANDLVRSAHGLLDKGLPSGVTLHLDLDPTAGAVRVDPVQIEQVLINLALNARDAIPESGGSITISTRHLSADAHAQVEICVADTGAGMPEAVRARAFEPFYTTKEIGRGTGLGLAMAHGIVAQSTGTIHIDSTPGEGTRVVIRLPRVVAAPTAEIVAAPASRVQLDGLSALVVDDEPAVRSMVVRMLQEGGCQTHEASNAEQALALAEAHTVDLLLIDVVMPGMSGVDLLTELRRRGFAQPALLMSGHAAEKVAEAGGLNAPLLQKPFSADNLSLSLSRLVRMSA